MPEFVGPGLLGELQPRVAPARWQRQARHEARAMLPPDHPMAGVADIAYIVGGPDPRMAALPVKDSAVWAYARALGVPAVLSMGDLLDRVEWAWPRRVYDWMADGL